jgi:D-alanyl-D-alanine endopeptidase (penicillin-binding protein 7)
MEFIDKKHQQSLRTVIGVLLGLVGFCALAAAKPVTVPRDPNLKSASVLVVDQTDSAVLLSKRADVAAPIASITKLMTALVVLDAHQSLDDLLEVTSSDQDFGKGWFSRLSVGTVLSRGDLMHLALMASENRAAHALGSNYPGGVPAIVDAMNAKAAELGMTTAHFVDPTGLSSQNVASAADLAKLVIAASRNPTIREYSTDKNYTVRIHGRPMEFRNTDKLVANPAWNIVVQKTGYISEAGRCLVMETVIEGRSLVIVLLDSLGKYTRLADATRVKNWVLANGGARLSRVSMR